MISDAMRYICYNLPEREKEVICSDKIEVYFCGKPEFTFYLKDTERFKAGDIVRKNSSLGYRGDKPSGSFLAYDYDAARAWNLRNAGCDLSLNHSSKNKLTTNKS